MKSYEVVESNNLEELKAKVRAMIKDGYRPTGGLTVYSYQKNALTMGHWYGQAMVHNSLVTVSVENRG